MSSETRYRLYLDGTAADREQLDRVETITVEQEVDLAWEARVELPICLDRNGRWQGVDEEFMAPGSRLRIEVALANDEFVPLIDGPVVARKPRLEREPGQSMLTVTVHDDTWELNRDEESISFGEDTTILDMVAGLFDGREHIHETDIDEDLTNAPEAPFALRGNRTAMSLLRCLAQIHGRHVYVLPGERPGQSIGCFRRFPDPDDRGSRGLPPLILNGDEANFSGFDSSQDLDRPEETRAAGIRMSDKRVVSAEASYRDRHRLGDREALSGTARPARRRLHPHHCAGMDLDQATTAQAEESGLAFEATGRILAGCYRGVLRPYRLVEVQLGETAMSGEWAIHQVTHTLTRSSYGQSFTLQRDAMSETQSERETEADLRRSVF